MPGLILDQGLPRSAARIFRETGWDAEHTGDILLLQNWQSMSDHLDKGAMVSITGCFLRIKKLPVLGSPE